MIDELSDSSVGLSVCWRNNPDGSFHSDQVEFLRTPDGGKTRTLRPVDGTEWERNESTWIELDNGELLCVMPSNFDPYLAILRSRDTGKSWSETSPAIPYHGASKPGLVQARDGVLILAVRVWGLFTSTDRGYTWSRPTFIGGYNGSGTYAHLVAMSDGQILVLGDDDHQFVKAQFITVDKDDVIHPAPPGPMQ